VLQPASDPRAVRSKAQSGTGPGPFDLGARAAYAAWRADKLRNHPAAVADLVVPVRDPRALTATERAALIERIGRANMALYESALGEADKDLPRLVGRQLGLTHLDRNWLADDDGISSVTVRTEGARGDYIPYTNRPIRWHTDGYYNPPDRRIRAMLLHCVASAASGGENALLDHEIAYLRLRDADPRFAAALTLPDAMTIPARRDDDGVVRPAQTGPVFSVDSHDGTLHMRYTARTRSIEWKDDLAVRAAVAFLERLLAAPSPHVFRVTLRPGMGIVCNNVLHDRSGFVDDPARPRLLYRARFHERIAANP
jgi:alpha-ketoglutarate-dependent taurine dioxygenase